MRGGVGGLLSVRKTGAARFINKTDSVHLAQPWPECLKLSSSRKRWRLREGWSLRGGVFRGCVLERKWVVYNDSSPKKKANRFSCNPLYLFSMWPITPSQTTKGSLRDVRSESGMKKMARLCRSIFTRFSPQPLTLFWNVRGREWSTAELNLPSSYDLSRKSQPRRQRLPPLLTFTLFRAHKRTGTHLRNDSGEI